MTGAPAPPTPYPPPGVTTTESEVERLRAALREWVVAIVSSYEIDHFPECWEAHPGLVMELAALHSWHTAAGAPGAAANELFLWHDALARFRDRLGSWSRRCAGGCTKRAAEGPASPPEVPTSSAPAVST